MGYMGDGVNDLPAMHASEIAISASTGSEAVRQSADVMLTHKNLDVLLRGITQSRRTCVNMMKYIKLALSFEFRQYHLVMRRRVPAVRAHGTRADGAAEPHIRPGLSRDPMGPRRRRCPALPRPVGHGRLSPGS